MFTRHQCHRYRQKYHKRPHRSRHHDSQCQLQHRTKQVSAAGMMYARGKTSSWSFSRPQSLRFTNLSHYSTAINININNNDINYHLLHQTKPRTRRFFGDDCINNNLLLINVLREKVQSGGMVYDDAQEKAARRLSKLQTALGGYSNERIIERIERRLKKAAAKQKNDHDSDLNKQKIDQKKKQAEGRATGGEYPKNNNSMGEKQSKDDEVERFMIPRGMFIHGNVGTGKSYLMDLFFECTAVYKKRRVHFHSFMQDVHQRIHQLKQEDLATKGRNFSIDTSTESNPIHRVAVQLANEVSLLCFDEFQVTDVADALILSQLFMVLFSRGTVIVATSNRHPSTLYEGGLNRDYFLPFIDLLCRHCIVHGIGSTTDYRSIGAEGIENFFFNNHNEGQISRYNQFLEDNFQTSQFEERTIDTAFNRTLTVRAVNDTNVAKFDFDDLCNKELGSSDYRAIAQQFNLIIIDNIPQLSLEEHDRARRFITLVDELYEADCALLCSAASSPATLFIGRDNLHDERHFAADHVETDIGETLGIDAAQSNGVAISELASVRELSFAFVRAASRLKEMTSKKHWEKRGITC